MGGIIQHTGSIGSGHYVAYCRHKKRNTWLEFDDARVREVGADTLESVEPYVLFYKRIVSSTHKEEVKTFKDQYKRSPAKDARLIHIPKIWYVRLTTLSRPGPV